VNLRLTRRRRLVPKLVSAYLAGERRSLNPKRKPALRSGIVPDVANPHPAGYI